MNILVIDIGGTHVKIWKTEDAEKTKLPSGKELTPEVLLDEIRQVTTNWSVERVSIGYPGEVRNGTPVTEPYNLGTGWVDADLTTAFACPVRIMNDAAMQALGSYEGGRMLYLGLGTSLGSTLIHEGVIIPLALGGLKLEADKTMEECLNRAGLETSGKKRWRQSVDEAARMLDDVFKPDYIVLGGGQIDEIKDLPENCRRGGNHNAYFGGLRMWEDARDTLRSLT